MNIFNLPTKIVMNEGALSYIKELKFERACIICDPFVVQSGQIKLITDILDECGKGYAIFSDIMPDAPIDNIKDGLSRFATHKPDAIISIGGGSALDTAKAIAYFHNRITGEIPTLKIAIPTTSGTGSEVTSFSVISDPSTSSKYPIVDEKLLPDVAILDPEFVRSVPQSITAATGMDVLTHAIEAYVAKGTDDFSAALSEKAARLVFRYLPRAYEQPDNLRARSKMHNASCMAGIAFNHAGLGLCHGMAHALGGMFHIPHGKANAILLPHVIIYNADFLNNPVHTSYVADKYAFFAGILGFISPSTKIGLPSLIHEIGKLMKAVNLEDNISMLGIDKDTFMEKLDALAEAAINDGCTKANPREVTREAIKEIYLNAYFGRGLV